MVDVPFRPDALTALNGKYDANKNQLRIRGNAAVFGVTNTVRVYAGSRSGDFDEDGDLRTGVTAPPLLGSQLIAPDGTFDLRVTPSNPALPNGRITLITTAGAIAENAPAGAIIAVPLAASRVVASVARKVRVPAGKVRVRLVIKAKAKRGNRCLLRTTRKALQRKTCGLKQTVFNMTAKRGTVVYVQISGKKQKTVNTRKIRL